MLVVKHHDWLAANPEYMAWCRGKLESVARQPPAPLRFDSATANGDRKWDSFAGEAGVALLAHDRNDSLARCLVAVSTLSFHYSTTSRTLTRASQRREQLGEDFDRMLYLAVRWAARRPALSLARRLRTDTDVEDDHAGKEALIEEFADRRLPTELPDSPKSKLTKHIRKPKATWVEPKFYADVEYRDVTTEGLLRASSFKNLSRNDKT
ncbi:hypothetical protein ACFIOY_35795 [Bradyrhizobium sp. TZ2]